MTFLHDYYYPPKEGEKRATVLCMRCAARVRTPEMTDEEIKANYREKRMRWVNENGINGDGIIILCPACLPLNIETEYLPLIHKQIMKALENEAKWAKLSPKTTLKNMKIMNQEAT